MICTAAAATKPVTAAENGSAVTAAANTVTSTTPCNAVLQHLSIYDDNFMTLHDMFAASTTCGHLHGNHCSVVPHVLT